MTDLGPLSIRFNNAAAPVSPGPQEEAPLICWWCHKPPVGVSISNDEGTIHMCSSCATQVANFLTPPSTLPRRAPRRSHDKTKISVR